MNEKPNIFPCNGKLGNQKNPNRIRKGEEKKTQRKKSRNKITTTKIKQKF